MDASGEYVSSHNCKLISLSRHKLVLPAIVSMCHCYVRQQQRLMINCFHLAVQGGYTAVVVTVSAGSSNWVGCLDTQSVS